MQNLQELYIEAEWGYYNIYFSCFNISSSIQLVNLYGPNADKLKFYEEIRQKI